MKVLHKAWWGGSLSGFILLNLDFSVAYYNIKPGTGTAQHVAYNFADWEEEKDWRLSIYPLRFFNPPPQYFKVTNSFSHVAWEQYNLVGTVACNTVTSHKTMPEVLCPLICVFLCHFCHSHTQRKVCLHSLLAEMVMAVMGMRGISHCGLLWPQVMRVCLQAAVASLSC